MEIFIEVMNESIRAQKKHGDQNHLSSISPYLLDKDDVSRAEEYEIATQTRAKFITDLNFERKELTWAHIAVEELSEVICSKDEKEMRTELIQLMSVCERWIQAIDNRK